VQDLTRIEAADLLWLERHDPHGLAVTGDKLDFVRFAVAVQEDNGPDIPRLEPMLRKWPSQYDGIMFFDRHPTGFSSSMQKNHSAFGPPTGCKGLRRYPLNFFGRIVALSEYGIGMAGAKGFEKIG
jgi:hypothetical protein